MPGGRARGEHRAGMPIWPFHRSRAEKDAELLLSAVTQASRRPGFFGEGRVPDTLEGRFEVLAIHGALAILRLRTEAPTLAQAFTDGMFSLIDAGLREAGAADTAVPKRMHRLAGDFYGRLTAYRGALTDPPALEAAMARNVWRQPSHPFAAALANYVVGVTAFQSERAISAMFSAEGWPAI